MVTALLPPPQWDVGMATAAHAPRGRGFDHALIYFHHCNDHWTSTVSNATDAFCSPASATVDLWTHGGPARERRGAWRGEYEEALFMGAASRLIAEFAANASAAAAASTAAASVGPNGSSSAPRGRSAPSLFLYYASHVPHTPLQAPRPY